MVKKQKEELKCLRCGYSWNPQTRNPKVCPRCKSFSWNMPRVRDKKPSMWNNLEKKSKNSKGNLKKSIYVKGKSWGEVAEKSGMFN